MDKPKAKLGKIPPRKIKFDVSSEVPKFWNNGCPAKTYFFNALGMVVPAFERMGIVSILNFREQIQGHPVYSDVKGFVGQEAAHSAVYIHYNRSLEQHGYEVNKLEKRNIKFFYLLSRICSKKFLLANTIAVEHLTAIWSHCALKRPYWFEGADPTFAAIWRWHAIEEIEHKSVAYDVYEAIKGSYLTRVLGMLTVSLSITGFMTRNIWHMMGKDGNRWNIKLWMKMFKTYWGKEGFLRHAIKPYFAYYRPNFHPWQQNDMYLISKWKKYMDESGDSLEKIAKRLESIEPDYA